MSVMFFKLLYLTGWMYEIKKSMNRSGTFPVRSKGPLHVHLVPYSEHSSFSELKEYVKFIRPQKVGVDRKLPCR